jgi:hypothetical protein
LKGLYGISAVSACHRLLRIFSDDANRIALEQELAFATEFYGNATEADIEALATRNGWDAPGNSVPCPFPFITTCLIAGASYNPESGTYSSVHEERFGMAYNEGDNNDGITILDITTLSNIRYCFVDFKGISSRQEVPLHTPLDGWTYLRAYCDDPDAIAVDNKATIDGLDKYALVDLSALADCWPDERWKTTTAGDDSTRGLAPTEADKPSVPSLRSLSQQKLFQELLSSDGPSDMTLLDEPMLFRGFASDFQRFILDNADALSKRGPSVTIPILKKAFVGEKTFDFTPFRGKLSVDDIVALVSSEALRAVKTVNLSGFDSTTDLSAVAAVVEHLKLDSLYMLARPDREADNISETLDTLSNCSHHPLVHQKLVLGSAFSRSIRMNFWEPQPPLVVDSRCWKTFPIIQLLYQGPAHFHMYSDIWLTNFFLGDSFLTPVRFVTGLLNIIKGRFIDPMSKHFFQVRSLPFKEQTYPIFQPPCPTKTQQAAVHETSHGHLVAHVSPS